jgi:DNA gyrase/topoisomerase IV subunit A
VNKAVLLERIADMVREGRIDGISNLRDESDRTGMRMVIELKRDAQAKVVLKNLYKHSQLQTTFGINMLALGGARYAASRADPQASAGRVHRSSAGSDHAAH